MFGAMMTAATSQAKSAPVLTLSQVNITSRTMAKGHWKASGTALSAQEAQTVSGRPADDGSSAHAAKMIGLRLRGDTRKRPFSNGSCWPNAAEDRAWLSSD
jgi:hypothetical protein